jgi:hypothetical protein
VLVLVGVRVRVGVHACVSFRTSSGSVLLVSFLSLLASFQPRRTLGRSWAQIKQIDASGRVPKPVHGGLNGNRKEVVHRANILVVLVIICT